MCFLSYVQLRISERERGRGRLNNEYQKKNPTWIEVIDFIVSQQDGVTIFKIMCYILWKRIGRLQTQRKDRKCVTWSVYYTCVLNSCTILHKNEQIVYVHQKHLFKNNTIVILTAYQALWNQVCVEVWWDLNRHSGKECYSCKLGLNLPTRAPVCFTPKTSISTTVVILQYILNPHNAISFCQNSLSPSEKVYTWY